MRMKITFFVVAAIVALGTAGSASAQRVRELRNQPTSAQRVRDFSRVATTPVAPGKPIDFQAHNCRVASLWLSFMDKATTEGAEITLTKCTSRPMVKRVELTFNRNYPDLGAPVNVMGRALPETVFARWVALVTAALTSGKPLGVWCDNTKVIDGVAYCSMPTGLRIE